MKTTFTLFTFLALSLFGSRASAAIGSKLHLNLFGDGNFIVVVDGIRYTDVRGNLDVFQLRAGTHQVRIVEVFGRRGRGRNGNRGREVLYNGSINIPFNSAVFARLTNNLRLRVTEIRPLPRPVRQPRYRRNNSNRRYDPPQRRRGYGNNRGYNNAFGVTKMEMRAASFDRDKVAIAKQFVRTSNPTSFEVGQLMSMLAFDKSKLQLAKFSYPFVRDRQNYNQINRNFDFDSSVREMNRFLSNRHQAPRRQQQRRR